VFTSTTLTRRRLSRPALAALLALAALALVPGRADALTASFSFTPAAPAPGQSVTFTASATPDAGQNVTGFSWSFGDGGTATGATVTHAFARERFTVTLIVDAETPAVAPATEATSASATATRTITVNTPPVARFTFTPANPIPGTGMTFTSASTVAGAAPAYSWDLNGDGRFGDATTPTATWTFLTATTATVQLRVTDDLGATSTARQRVVIDAPPSASFTVAPANPLVGQAVKFTSTSTDPDGPVSALTFAWDLTGNGLFSDATGSTAQRVFSQSGDAIVRLRVTDARGASAIAAMTIPVGGPPIASFDVSASPTAGRPVTFTSTSRDIDGAIAKTAWDLDGNGVFNDAAGPTATWTYETPGTYTVALRATDTSGLTDIAFHSITVRAAPGAPAAPGASAVAPVARGARPAQPLLPFPIVRIAGRVNGRSTFISLLEVRAPTGARIRVTCGGRGCPKQDLTAVATQRATRFPKIRRRLRAGAVIQVFVRANGRIGKYTRFRIRRARPPLRRDMCLPPTRRGPAPCTG
jgi:PKD repeat protein